MAIFFRAVDDVNIFLPVPGGLGNDEVSNELTLEDVSDRQMDIEESVVVGIGIGVFGSEDNVKFVVGWDSTTECSSRSVPGR